MWIVKTVDKVKIIIRGIFWFWNQTAPCIHSRPSPDLILDCMNKHVTHCASLCDISFGLNVLIQKDSNWAMHYPLPLLNSAGEGLCCVVSHPPVTHPPRWVEECESRIHHASLISLNTYSTWRDQTEERLWIFYNSISTAYSYSRVWLTLIKYGWIF